MVLDDKNFVTTSFKMRSTEPTTVISFSIMMQIRNQLAKNELDRSLTYISLSGTSLGQSMRLFLDKLAPLLLHTRAHAHVCFLFRNQQTNLVGFVIFVSQKRRSHKFTFFFQVKQNYFSRKFKR